MAVEGNHGAVDTTLLCLIDCSAEHLLVAEVDAVEGSERGNCPNARQVVSPKMVDLHRTVQTIGGSIEPLPTL